MNQFCLGKTLGEMSWRMTVSVEKVEIIFPPLEVGSHFTLHTSTGRTRQIVFNRQVENPKCWLKNVDHLVWQF